MIKHVLVFSKFKGFTLIFALITLSFLIAGGCNNNKGGDDPPVTTSCTPISSPCTKVTINNDSTVATCELSDTTCGVDLMDVVTQVGNGVTAATTMWISAWGGNGGDVDKAEFGGNGGYAQTTTSVSTLMGMNNGSSEIFYFLASSGNFGGDHCGGGGAAATIVTLEDLTLNPTGTPTQTAPPFLLVAAGAGGGSGGNGEFGCGDCKNPGSDGGTAIADETGNKNGPGQGNGCTVDGGSDGKGSPGCITAGGDTLPASGENGFGGRGGAGGDGR